MHGSRRRDRLRIWFHRSRAVAWGVVAVLSMPWFFGWIDSVRLISMASLYANIASDWSASEAADDRQVLALLTEIQQQTRRRAARRRPAATPPIRSVALTRQQRRRRRS